MNNQKFFNKFELLYSGFFFVLLFTILNCDVEPKPEPPIDPPIVRDTIANPDPNRSLTTNIEFHEISWQYFHWLTEDIGGGTLRFETFNTDASLMPNAAEKQGSKLVLGRMRKTGKNSIGGVNQADSEGILVDKSGRAVYTSILFNDTYKDFIINNKLNTIEGLENVVDTLDFPIGSISLKVAWKLVAEGEDVSKFYTTKADIQLLSTNAQGEVYIPKDAKVEKDVDVAMVGFHIAFVINGHPEFVWATFEHDENAPDAQVNQQMNQAVSNKDFTFYKAGTVMADCNVNNRPILSLDEATQKLDPVTQVARQYRLGGGTSQNQNNIDTVNVVMHSKLPTNSIWKNYAEVGAIWFNQPDALVPDWSPTIDSTIQTGSVELSNASIETFTQGIISENNCFKCHNTLSLTNVPATANIIPGKNVLTSHVIITEYYSDLAQK